MKKHLVSLLLMLLLFHNLKAQKQPLQLESYKDWPVVTNGNLSNDGKFCFYNIENYSPSKNVVIVQETGGNFKKEILNLNNAKFSNDSRILCGQLKNDTLLILDLYDTYQKKITNVRDYKLLNSSSDHTLVYLENNGMLNIASNSGHIAFSYPSVNEYVISPSGEKMIIKQFLPLENKSIEQISIVDVSSGTKQIMCNGLSTGNYTFDGSEGKVAYSAQKSDSTSIWYFNLADKKSKMLVYPGANGIDSSLNIDFDNFRFSNDNKRIFFTLKEKQKLTKDDHNSDLEIWSYEDAYLRSSYFGHSLGIASPLKQYLSVVNIDNGNIIQLLHGVEQIVAPFNSSTDSLLLIKSSFGPENEKWNANSRLSYYLCNTKTGLRSSIALNRKTSLNRLEISPKGKYVVFFDPEAKSYCSYEIASGITRKLTENLPLKDFVNYKYEKYPWPESLPNEILGWLIDDNTILLQGMYDIWSIDSKNNKPPLKLTNSVGENSKIVFRPVDETIDRVYGKKGKLLLSAFNTINKDYGFYSLSLDGKFGLNELSMQNIYSEELENVYVQLPTNNFIKARDIDAFLFKYQTANQAPNYHFTKDLKNYSPISNIQPQANYNWLSSELHTYTDKLGNQYQGVLYKPENFDQKKTYPIVFDIYEIKSNLLNSFPDNELPGGEIAISFLVSNGYLVFLPDIIKYRSKLVGEDVLNSVLAAADHLKKFSWIDQKRIGIAGGSTGGFETNYIITHSNRFAAAISGAGISNMISLATTLRYGVANINSLNGYGIMMGSSLPEDPETYIKNSPILFSKKVVTPLLLLHNSQDDAVDYTQSQSFFIALRNLGKKVWWLNYKTEGHGLYEMKNRLDFHTKSIQFWDYYLKDKAEPKWMSNHLSPTNRQERPDY